jgi:hypothetical protein
VQRAACRFQTPKCVVVISALPTNASGRILKRELKERSSDVAAADEGRSQVKTDRSAHEHSTAGARSISSLGTFDRCRQVCCPVCATHSSDRRNLERPSAS